MDSFLRIGPKELISPELELHRKLLTYGFPVPQITSEGIKDGRQYYIENSVGDTLLGTVFAEDSKKGEGVSREHFSDLVSLTSIFAEAQLKTLESREAFNEFYKGIHVDVLEEELPELKDTIRLAVEKLQKGTASLPTVLSHGDLNPHNLFKKGVIDFGSSFHAPAGYDLITNLYHIYNFPADSSHENARRYDFTAEQRAEYLSTMDKIYEKHHLPKVSDFLNHFIFARAIWSAVKMDHYPKLQAWRYEQFKKILDTYISGGDLAELVTRNKL